MKRILWALLTGWVLSQIGFGQTVNSGNWSTLSTNGDPTARHEAAMVEFGGKAYLFGGRGIKPVEEFDPATGKWRQLGPTPLEIHHFQPVVYGDRVYVMTAMTGRYPKETPLDSIYIWDPKGDTWEKGPIVPKDRRRGGAGTVVYQGKIYLVAGIIDGHTSGTIPWFDEFDPATGEWRQLEDAPHARDHFSAVVVGEELYAVGGRNSSYHEPDNFTAFFGTVIPEVDVYDFEKKQWRTLANGLPTPTAAGGLVQLGGDVYYFGGESSQALAHSDTQRLNVKTGTWTPLAPLQRGRHGSGAAVINGKIYVAAGSGGRGGGPELTSTEAFSLGP
jgi:N-acetylneuraminic acid mutarotase